MLGLETELAVRTDDDRHAASGCTGWSRRWHRTWRPTVCSRAPAAATAGCSTAIPARYLALVGTDAAGDTAEDVAARDTARNIVMTSAQSAWDYRQSVDGLPLFGPFWDRTPEVPTSSGSAQFAGGAVYSSSIPERDLSVQLSGWMLIEAAHTLTAE